ncbi:MAG: hypothetical protein RQ746_07560, partial [Bacteroidales bacterium]|nr:hypothetical protein [Bacteroidales bacterium]
TRLNFDYTGERLTTGLVLQDVRLWGSQAQLVSNEDFATSVHQAWIEYAFEGGWAFKAGRQELVYDNHRIFGNVGWAQQARSHDLLLFKYEGELKLHAGLAYHENSVRTNNFYTGPDAYKTMQFVWMNNSFEQFDISLLFLNNGVPVVRQTNLQGRMTRQGISFSQTIGTYVEANVDEQLSVIFSTYFQGGRDGDEIRKRAWYVNGEGHLGLEEIDVVLGYELISGNGFDETGTNRSFTPFYGTNHKFNGHMDYFYVGNHMNSVGLSDLYLKGNMQVGRTMLNGAVHLFHAAAEVAPAAGSYLGTEADLGAGWNLGDGVKLNVGYSHLFAGESMEILKGGDREALHNWAWVMVAVNPVFFTSE